MAFAVNFPTFTCLPQINSGDPSVPRSQGAQKFKLSIVEKNARFYEKVEINEDEEFAHFRVPSHNELEATDKLINFKMVRDLKRFRLCNCYF